MAAGIDAIGSTVRQTIGRALEICARHGRLVLVAGLVAGISLPDLAQAMRPHLPWMVAVLLFFSAFRIGPSETLGQLTRLWRPLRDVVALQLLMPVLGFAVFTLAGVIDTVPALAVMLMLSAPSITGAPNFVVLAGKDPAPAMQILIFGTALFPLTVLPVLWLMQGAMPGAGDVLAAAGRLVLVVALAVALGFAARAVILSPDVILADEPTGNVDWEMSERLMTLLVELNKMGKTVLIATHDLGMIRAMKSAVSARVSRLKDGQLLQAGADL